MPVRRMCNQTVYSECPEHTLQVSALGPECSVPSPAERPSTGHVNTPSAWNSCEHMGEDVSLVGAHLLLSRLTHPQLMRSVRFMYLTVVNHESPYPSQSPKLVLASEPLCWLVPVTEQVFTFPCDQFFSLSHLVACMTTRG